MAVALGMTIRFEPSQNRQFFWIALVLCGIGLAALAAATMYARAAIELNGVVSEAVHSKDPSGPDRFFTTYVIQGRDGSDTTYVAGYNDAALRRDIPIGATLAKEKWRLDYQINGNLVDDFPWKAYVLFESLGVALFVAGAVLIWRRRQASGT